MTAQVPRTLGIGIIGYGFMGRAHSNAYHQIRRAFWPLSPDVRLVSIAGRSEEGVAAAAARYGFARYETDWHRLIADPDVDLVDICAWHDLHAPAALEALRAGKHVLCEKPMALTAADARAMRDLAAAGDRVHRVAFNYRFAPAVIMARRLAADGTLGQINHVRISYLQGFLADAASPYPWEDRTTGAIHNLGSHAIDMARYLVGEPRSVFGFVRNVHPMRPLRGDPDPSLMAPIAMDDLAVASIEFENGALGTLEASWVAAGRKNQLTIELNGSAGSVHWDLEDLNWLHVRRPGARGFEAVLVTEPGDPFMEGWWPPGHILGWEHLHANLILEFIRAIGPEPMKESLGATFEDGYRAAVITEAIQASGRSGRSVDIAY
jgi:predicted dehydrogenase